MSEADIEEMFNFADKEGLAIVTFGQSGDTDFNEIIPHSLFLSLPLPGRGRRKKTSSVI